MRRVDDVVRQFRTSDTSAQIAPGVWVPALGCPYSYGILSRGYWRKWKCRAKDAWKVFLGYAEAVDWGQGRKH